VSLSPVQPVPKMQPDRIVSTEYAHASQHVPRRFPNPYAQTPMTAGSEIFGDHPTSRMSYTSSHTTNPTLESPTALTEQFSTVAPTQHAPVDFQPPFPPPCQLPAQLVAPMNIPSHELLSSQDIWNSTNPFRYNSTSQQVLRDTSIPNMDWDDFFAHVRQDTTGM
jgi:hypothetical protein